MRLDSASGRADVAATVAAIVAVALLPAANFGAGRGVTATLLVDISLREDASAEGSRSRLGATGEGRGNESECMPRQCAPERPNYVHIANHAALSLAQFSSRTLIDRLPARGQSSVPHARVQFGLDLIAAVATVAAADVAVARHLAR